MCFQRYCTKVGQSCRRRIPSHWPRSQAEFPIFVPPFPARAMLTWLSKMSVSNFPVVSPDPSQIRARIHPVFWQRTYNCRITRGPLAKNSRYVQQSLSSLLTHCNWLIVVACLVLHCGPHSKTKTIRPQVSQTDFGSGAGHGWPEPRSFRRPEFQWTFRRRTVRRALRKWSTIQWKSLHPTTGLQPFLE